MYDIILVLVFIKNLVSFLSNLLMRKIKSIEMDTKAARHTVFILKSFISSTYMSESEFSFFNQNKCRSKLDVRHENSLIVPTKCIYNWCYYILLDCIYIFFILLLTYICF